MLGSGERLKVCTLTKSEEKGKRERKERTMFWESITTWSHILFDFCQIQVSVRKCSIRRSWWRLKAGPLQDLNGRWESSYLTAEFHRKISPFHNRLLKKKIFVYMYFKWTSNRNFPEEWNSQLTCQTDFFSDLIPEGMPLLSHHSFQIMVKCRLCVLFTCLW